MPSDSLMTGDNDDEQISLDESEWLRAKLENSVEGYKKYIENYPSGLHATEAKISMESMLVYNEYINIADAAYKTGKYKIACENYDNVIAVIKYKSDNQSPLFKTIVENRDRSNDNLKKQEIAKAALLNGNYDDAKKVYGELLSHNPGDMISVVGLARVEELSDKIEINKADMQAWKEACEINTTKSYEGSTI